MCKDELNFYETGKSKLKELWKGECECLLDLKDFTRLSENLSPEGW